MIEIKNLTKVHKLNKKKMMELRTKETTKKAANNISLTARPGEIYGLLGPNGAGKTTTLRCVATLLTPTEGTVSVCGYDTVKQPEKVRESICFLTNEIKLDPHFSPKYSSFSEDCTVSTRQPLRPVVRNSLSTLRLRILKTRKLRSFPPV